MGELALIISILSLMIGSVAYLCGGGRMDASIVETEEALRRAVEETKGRLVENPL